MACFLIFVGVYLGGFFILFLRGLFLSIDEVYNDFSDVIFANTIRLVICIFWPFCLMLFLIFYAGLEIYDRFDNLEQE